MHFRCHHILTLLRELPFATILSFHGNRSTVSSTKSPLCLAPTGNSLEVKIFVYYSASSRLWLSIIPQGFWFVNRLFKKILCGGEISFSFYIFCVVIGCGATVIIFFGSGFSAAEGSPRWGCSYGDFLHNCSSVVSLLTKNKTNEKERVEEIFTRYNKKIYEISGKLLTLAL